MFQMSMLNCQEWKENEKLKKHFFFKEVYWIPKKKPKKKHLTSPDFTYQFPFFPLIFAEGGFKSKDKVNNPRIFFFFFRA